MIAVGHTSVGVIIGVVASEVLSPTLSAPTQVILVGLAGLGSHYLMDLAPHGHYDMNMKEPSQLEVAKLLADVILPVLLVGSYLLISNGLALKTWLVGAGIIGAQLPDIVMGLRERRLLPSWLMLDREAYFHSRTHWHNPKDSAKATNEGGRRLGISDVWQAAVVCLALLLLLA